MREIGLKIASLFMTLVLLVSTMSFSIKKNYCTDTSTSTVLVLSDNFNQAECSAFEEECCASKSESCCSYEYFIVEGQHELLMNSLGNSTFLPQVYNIPSVNPILGNYKSQRSQIVPFKEYSAPILVVETTLLNQVFRI